MDKTFSYTSLEKKLTPEFRKKVNAAETVTDLKNIYSQTMTAFLEHIDAPQMNFAPGDISFDPHAVKFVTIHPRLQKKGAFKKLAEHSDLMPVIERFARSLNRRYVHLQKHLEKTNLKIRK